MARTTKRAITPLAVAAQAASAAEHAAQVAEDIHRGQRGDDPDTVEAPLDPRAAAAFDAIDDFFDELDATEEPARVDVYLRAPLPPGIRRQMWLATIDNLQDIADRRGELVRIVQSAGKWGDVELQLGAKERNPVTHRWDFTRHSMVALHVPKPDFAAAALPTNGVAAASPVDPIAAAEKMLEAGARLTPKPTTPAADPLEFLVKAKAAGLIGESSIEKLVPLVASLSGVLKDLFGQRGPSPYEAMMLEFVKAQMNAAKPRDEMKQMDALLNFADRIADRLGGGGSGGEASLGVVALKEGAEVLRSYAPAAQRIADAIYMRNAGPAGRPAPRRPARIEIVPGPAQALMAVLEHAGAWAMEAASTQNELATVRHFPELLRDLTTRVPGCADLLEDLRAGKVTPDDAFTAMTAIGVQVVEPLTTYLRRFLAWAKMGGREAPPAPPSPTVSSPPAAAAGSATAAGAPPIGRCDRCHAEYVLAGDDTDHDPCDAPDNASGNARCGGKILPLPAEAP